MIKREQERCVDSSERAALETYTEHTLLPFTQASGESRLGSSDCFTSGSTPARHYGSFSPVSINEFYDFNCLTLFSGPLFIELFFAVGPGYQTLGFRAGPIPRQHFFYSKQRFREPFVESIQPHVLLLAVW
ncbi:hypothetical protein NC652_006079 [Populus alba x Populus x berolinensis]|nr:hypothetical protein NC652_006079 [Populus alba x Populus x berolinensis]